MNIKSITQSTTNFIHKAGVEIKAAAIQTKNVFLESATKNPKQMATLCTPIAGIVIQYLMENKVSDNISIAIKAHDTHRIVELIKEKNQIKKSAIIGLAIHALVFAGLTVFFPLVGSSLCSFYCCMIAKNLINVNANKKLIKDLEEDVYVFHKPTNNQKQFTTQLVE